jgi:hypothetical protein
LVLCVTPRYSPDFREEAKNWLTRSQVSQPNNVSPQLSASSGLRSI